MLRGFYHRNCAPAICVAANPNGTGRLTTTCNSHRSLIIDINNSKAFGRILTNLCTTNYAAPVKCVPYKDAGSFTDDVSLPGSLLGTASGVLSKQIRACSTKSFNKQLFSCITSFNTFAQMSCSAPRRAGGILNRLTCILRKTGSLSSLHH